MIFRFAGDLVMNWPGLPWVECDLLWDKKVEARIPFVEMSVVLVKVSYLSEKGFILILTSSPDPPTSSI